MRIGLKGLNRYSPGHRPELGNSSDTVHYRPERPKQIYNLQFTILNARDSKLRRVVRIGLKGLNRYSPGHRPGLGNSSGTMPYRPEGPKQIYDLTIYNLRF